MQAPRLVRVARTVHRLRAVSRALDASLDAPDLVSVRAVTEAHGAALARGRLTGALAHGALIGGVAAAAVPLAVLAALPGSGNTCLQLSDSAVCRFGGHGVLGQADAAAQRALCAALAPPLPRPRAAAALLGVSITVRLLLWLPRVALRLAAALCCVAGAAVGALAALPAVALLRLQAAVLGGLSGALKSSAAPARGAPAMRGA